MDPFQPGLLQRIEAPRRVAIVRASRLGDFICATPAFRALRAALPRAQISLIALPMVREAAELSPYIDRFIAFPGFPGMAEQFFEARRATGFMDAMQSRRFDLAIQMHGSGANSNPFTLMLGARYTAGYIRPGEEPGELDAALPMPERGHEIDRALALAEFLGAPSQGGEIEFPVSRKDGAWAARLLARAPRPLIGIHAGAREAAKRWFPDRFAAAARELQERGGTIVLLGEDAAEGEYPAGTIDLTGKTTLGRLGGVIKLLDVLIGNDSGPAHIAYAVGTRTVTIFGGTDPAVWGPRDYVPRRILAPPVSWRTGSRDVSPKGDALLEAISVRNVVDAAVELLIAPGPVAGAGASVPPSPTTRR